MNKITQVLLVIVIVACAGISGYLLLRPSNSQNQTVSGFAPVVDGKQVLVMAVESVRYSPDSFKVKAGIPVRWEITSSGSPGCASGMIIANGLVKDPIYLNPEQGQVKVVEFTPQTPGTYKFNCSMNMVRGTIEVVN